VKESEQSSGHPNGGCLVVQGAQMHLYNSPLLVDSCVDLPLADVEQGRRPRPLYIVLVGLTRWTNGIVV